VSHFIAFIHVTTMHRSFLMFLLVVQALGDGDLCQTCTCTTSDDAHTLTTNCTNRGLHHVPGEWPGKNVTTIRAMFSGNDIPTLEPLALTDAVVEIVLSNCNIQYLRPELFAATKNIKFADLSHNLLLAEEISADKFKGPYNSTSYEPIAIEHLNLAYNKIHSLGKNVFEHMPNLKILNLEGNDFRVIDIHTQLAISSIRKLQSLNLANNELTEMIVTAIEHHENLTELNLSQNLLDFVPAILPTIGKSLEILILDDNPIIEFVSETFSGLPNVIELSVNNLTKLKYVNANTFASMPKLKKLSLSNNVLLKEIDREAFGTNQSIEEFYLNKNDLFRIDYKLLPWSKLHVFEFNDNPLDCSCDLYNISKALPRDITRVENGPYCMDPRSERYTFVYNLKSDICLVKSKYQTQKEFIQYHFSMVKVALIILSVVVMMIAVVAAVLGFIRYRKYQRNMSYPYSQTILYDPVHTTN
jgi:hypothetical protein